MVHPVNSLILVGGFVLLFALVIAVATILGNRRKRAAEFRNYFCSGFERGLFPSRSLREDETVGGNYPQFAHLRFSSSSDSERSLRIGQTQPRDLK